MALPNSRNKTYAQADTVRSSDMNDFQDRIVNAHEGAHGERKLWIPPVSIIGDTVFGRLGYTFQLTSAAYACAPLAMHEGDRITGLSLLYADSGSEHDLSLDIVGSNDSGFINEIANPFTSQGQSGNGLRVISGLSTTLAAATAYMLRIKTTSNGTLNIFGVGVTYDHPA